MKLTKIYQEGKLYLLRFAWPFKEGTFKIHVILRDDIEEPHTHPWDFKSFLLVPYKEERFHETTYGKMLMWTENYIPFSINKKRVPQVHRVKLYRLFGIPIPAITFGVYGRKKQLCSFCTELGYCKNER